MNSKQIRLVLAGALVFGLVMAVGLAARPARGGAFLMAALSETVHLPAVHSDVAPTPVPTPPPSPYSAAATLLITPNTDILASTYNPGSFVVTNESLNGERLTELRIDLTTAVFLDMVFDPYGAAGDTVAKDVVVDLREGLGFDGHSYDGTHGGGFDQLTLRFGNFDRGDRFAFSVDVDPTSITGVGAPGPYQTGSVGGLELVGATITATFDSGEVITNQVWRMAAPGDHSGAVAVLRPGLPPRPVLEVVGVGVPAAVGAAVQTVRVSGPVGRPVVVLVVEGGLFLDGVPGGGVEIDPFESNTALNTREYAAVIGPSGSVDVAVTLRKSLPEGGINLITAAFDDHYGVKGLVAEPAVLELE